MHRPRIIVLESAEGFRELYRTLLESEFDLIVLDDAERLIPGISEIQPQLVILDVSVTGKGGIEAAREVSEYFPGVKIVCVSLFANSVYAREARAAGAAGYVLKSSAAEDLPAAIREVLQGRTFCSELPLRSE